MAAEDSLPRHTNSKGSPPNAIRHKRTRRTRAINARKIVPFSGIYSPCAGCAVVRRQCAQDQRQRASQTGGGDSLSDAKQMQKSPGKSPAMPNGTADEVRRISRGWSYKIPSRDQGRIPAVLGQEHGLHIQTELGNSNSDRVGLQSAAGPVQQSSP
jgi:hypothetical protein